MTPLFTPTYPLSDLQIRIHWLDAYMTGKTLMRCRSKRPTSLPPQPPQVMEAQLQDSYFISSYCSYRVPILSLLGPTACPCLSGSSRELQRMWRWMQPSSTFPELRPISMVLLGLDYSEQRALEVYQRRGLRCNTRMADWVVTKNKDEHYPIPWSHGIN